MDFTSKAILINMRKPCEMIFEAKSGQYRLPGGRLKEGETHEEAVRRETREETGLDLPIYEDDAYGSIRYEDKLVKIYKYHVDGDKDILKPPPEAKHPVSYQNWFSLKGKLADEYKVAVALATQGLRGWEIKVYENRPGKVTITL